MGGKEEDPPPLGRRSVGMIFAHIKGLGKFTIYLSDKAVVNVIPPRPVSPTSNEGGVRKREGGRRRRREKCIFNLARNLGRRGGGGDRERGRGRRRKAMKSLSLFCLLRLSPLLSSSSSFPLIAYPFLLLFRGERENGFLSVSSIFCFIQLRRNRGLV